MIKKEKGKKKEKKSKPMMERYHFYVVTGNPSLVLMTTKKNDGLKENEDSTGGL